MHMSSEIINHTPRWRRATNAGVLQRPVESGHQIGKEGAIQHYYVLATPDGKGGFWIRFPDQHGIASAARGASDIVTQAQDTLASMLMNLSAVMPRSIEEGAKPPTNLGDYDDPVVVVVPFEPASATVAASAYRVPERLD
jgi:hypothetical protein